MSLQKDILVVDTRSKESYTEEGTVPGAWYIGLDGSFAPWVGALIADVKQPILLVTPYGKEKETVTRLSRVGFDNTLGVLKGGFEAWENAGKDVDTIKALTAREAKDTLEGKHLPIFDVRKASEYNAEHFIDANNAPLDTLNDHLAEFPKNETFYLHCEGGIHNLVDIAGGFAEMKKSGMEVTNYICPTTQ